MPAVRVLVSGVRLIAEGLQHMLQSSFTVVGVASSDEAAISLSASLHPDVVLMYSDLQQPAELDAILLRLRALHPAVKVMLVARKIRRLALRRALRMGVVGIVLLQQPPDALCDAIRTVAKGNFYLPPVLHAVPATPKAGDDESTGGDRFRLTTRQQEVLQLVAEGRTNRETAALLKISAKTVEYHRGCVVEKLGLRSVAELSRFAMQNGLVGPLA